jgi:hypothetical protein
LPLYVNSTQHVWLRKVSFLFEFPGLGNNR